MELKLGTKKEGGGGGIGGDGDGTPRGGQETEGGGQAGKDGAVLVTLNKYQRRRYK